METKMNDETKKWVELWWRYAQKPICYMPTINSSSPNYDKVDYYYYDERTQEIYVAINNINNKWVLLAAEPEEPEISDTLQKECDYDAAMRVLDE